MKILGYIDGKTLVAIDGKEMLIDPAQAQAEFPAQPAKKAKAPKETFTLPDETSVTAELETETAP